MTLPDPDDIIWYIFPYKKIKREVYKKDCIFKIILVKDDKKLVLIFSVSIFIKFTFIIDLIFSHFTLY